MIEGLICVLLAIPLFALIGGLSGMAMGAVCRWTHWPRHTIYGFVSLPRLMGGLGQYLPVPQQVRSVSRALIVPATPGRIWQQLTVAEHIQSREIGSAWMYRIGVPLPLSAVTELADNRHVRHIVMGKGIHFDQIAADWRVLWLYRLSRDSFAAGALDDHVRIGGRLFRFTRHRVRDARGRRWYGTSGDHEIPRQHGI